jgi:L-serine deaminase
MPASARCENLASTTHDAMIPLTVLKLQLTTIQEQRAAGGDVDPAVIAGAMSEAHYLGRAVSVANSDDRPGPS